MGVFGVEQVGGLGTDSGLSAGEFLVEGCLGIGDGQGRDV